jgi:dihydrofolate reductase
MIIALIVAMTKNQVIGDRGGIPWKILEDMKLFKEKTTNYPVIMGKNTWNSIPEKFRPLPNRENIILSTTLGEQTGASIAKNLSEALELAKKTNKEKVFCIGGAQIYSEMLPLANELNISWIKKEYLGDTYFPKINFSEWEEIEEKEYTEFTYKKYLRKK